MAGSFGACLLARERLKNRSEFRKVFEAGVRSDGRLVAVIALRNRLGRSRLGLTVGRRIGDAVARNRAKRLLRESFRRNKPPQEMSLDVVVVAKPNIAGRSLGEVEQDYRARIAELLGAGHRRPRRPRPSPHD